MCICEHGSSSIKTFWCCEMSYIYLEAKIKVIIYKTNKIKIFLEFLIPLESWLQFGLLVLFTDS
jgi:hypothetical protein